MRAIVGAGLALALLSAPGIAVGQPAAPSPASAASVSASSVVKYYYLYQGPDYIGGGYALKVKFAGAKIYINDPATDRCYTARRVATNKWRFRQPNASSEPGSVYGYATTNASRSWFKMIDQYGRDRYKVTSAAKARAWLVLWQESEPGFSWNDPPC